MALPVTRRVQKEVRDLFKTTELASVWFFGATDENNVVLRSLFAVADNDFAATDSTRTDGSAALPGTAAAQTERACTLEHCRSEHKIKATTMTSA